MAKIDFMNKILKMQWSHYFKLVIVIVNSTKMCFITTMWPMSSRVLEMFIQIICWINNLVKASQEKLACTMLTTEALEKGVKYVQR